MLLHSHHLLATVYESKGEFRSALQHEKEAYSIYNNKVKYWNTMFAGIVFIQETQLRNFFVSHMKVGEDHESTKESSEYLKSLTQQAVVLQKAINHIYSNAPSACAPPPKVCALLSTCLYFCSRGILSHLCFFPVFNTKPSHNPSAAQPDMWNCSHSAQVNSKTISVKKKQKNKQTTLLIRL